MVILMVDQEEFRSDSTTVVQCSVVSNSVV